jgi:hypothetical protein
MTNGGILMTQARERKARKHLKKLGYKLEKTPPRHWTRGFGGHRFVEVAAAMVREAA